MKKLPGYVLLSTPKDHDTPFIVMLLKYSVMLTFHDKNSMRSTRDRVFPLAKQMFPACSLSAAPETVRSQASIIFPGWRTNCSLSWITSSPPPCTTQDCFLRLLLSSLPWRMDYQFPSVSPFSLLHYFEPTNISPAYLPVKTVLAVMRTTTLKK